MREAATESTSTILDCTAGSLLHVTCWTRLFQTKSRWIQLLCVCACQPELGGRRLPKSLIVTRGPSGRAVTRMKASYSDRPQTRVLPTVSARTQLLEPFVKQRICLLRQGIFSKIVVFRWTIRTGNR